MKPIHGLDIPLEKCRLCRNQMFLLGVNDDSGVEKWVCDFCDTTWKIRHGFLEI